MHKRKRQNQGYRHPKKAVAFNFQLLNRSVLVDITKAKLKLGYESGRNCSTVQYFNAKANQLPEELKLNKVAQELNGILTETPAMPPQPEYINFPNMAAKEKDHRNPNRGFIACDQEIRDYDYASPVNGSEYRENEERPE